METKRPVRPVEEERLGMTAQKLELRVGDVLSVEARYGNGEIRQESWELLRRKRSGNIEYKVSYPVNTGIKRHGKVSGGVVELRQTRVTSLYFCCQTVYEGLRKKEGAGEVLHTWEVPPPGLTEPS